MNNVSLVGRLTKDATIKHTGTEGKANARFTLAVNRSFSKAQGEREADFIPCVAWGKIAENVANYTSKGALVSVKGRLQTGSYEKDGKKNYTFEIVVEEVGFLEKKNNNQQQQQNQGQNQGQQQQFGNPPQQQQQWGNQPQQQQQFGNPPQQQQGAQPIGFTPNKRDDLPF